MRTPGWPLSKPPRVGKGSVSARHRGSRRVARASGHPGACTAGARRSAGSDLVVRGHARGEAGGIQARSLEREGPGHRPNPSLCGGATVPLGRSLWPMRGSTPPVRQGHPMHRRPAGSQRPVVSIRSVRFDAHGACLGETRSCGGRGTKSRPRGRGGNSETGGWNGGGIRLGQAARRAGPGTLCPLAVGQSIDPSRAPGLVSSTPALCHAVSTSQKSICKFVQVSAQLPRFVAGPRHSRSTSWIHSRQRAFSLAWMPAARPSGHARAAWARRGDHRAAVMPA